MEQRTELRLRAALYCVLFGVEGGGGWELRGISNDMGKPVSQPACAYSLNGSGTNINGLKFTY